MATSRQERMQERLRGANVHQVQDVAFDFAFAVSPAQPAAQGAPEPSPVPRTTPNTSAKRKRLDEDAPPTRRSVPPQPQTQQNDAVLSARRRASKPDVYSMTDASSADERMHPRKSARKSTPPRREADKGTVPVTTPRVSSVAAVEEMVAESPADAPGSGQRQRLEPSSAISTSVLLQQGLSAMEAMNDEYEGLQASSPLLRKRGAAAESPPATVTRAGARRSARHSVKNAEEEDELSPEKSTESPQPRRRIKQLVAEEVLAETEGEEDELSGNFEEEAAEPQEEEAEEADEIGDVEAARYLGRGRSQRHHPAPSPELDSSISQEQPVPKRRRMTAKKSPAKQRQPKAPPTKSKRPSNAKQDESSGRIEITVQRFPKRKASDPEADELLGDIPQASRDSVNAVDVFRELSEQFISGILEKARGRLQSEEDASARREARVHKRALEAFKEELGTRLLEQTIALDNLHTLKQRVRRAQKDKITLRNEILRIRAEREQVALRMDAIRIKHEEDSKRAHHHIDLSSAMHDVDLAIEQGQAAPELSAAEQKLADLANLELLVSRVSEQACSTPEGGGTLNQIKSFNSFLERVAAAI
ncbi:AT hook domain-containing protein [Pleurostoma richardsiae]|uniref:AT hook domain-containing protein n=1 Tax=Pleurostoma richardsiae TaxID=41990 RepID=A0AA38RLI8_9PEZI|nr:AT hook domain-containing protein [Pleurostoma richardsiae]